MARTVEVSKKQTFRFANPAALSVLLAILPSGKRKRYQCIRGKMGFGRPAWSFRPGSILIALLSTGNGAMTRSAHCASPILTAVRTWCAR